MQSSTASRSAVDIKYDVIIILVCAAVHSASTRLSSAVMTNSRPSAFLYTYASFVLEDIVAAAPLVLVKAVDVQHEPRAVISGAVVRGEAPVIERAVRVGYYAYEARFRRDLSQAAELGEVYNDKWGDLVRDELNSGREEVALDIARGVIYLALEDIPTAAQDAASGPGLAEYTAAEPLVRPKARVQLPYRFRALVKRPGAPKSAFGLVYETAISGRNPPNPADPERQLGYVLHAADNLAVAENLRITPRPRRL